MTYTRARDQQIDVGGVEVGTYTVGEVSDQVIDGQAPRLQLVIQPSMVSRGSLHYAAR
jgi:hypothetical protein